MAGKQFFNVIKDYYPKLQECGGFELFLCVSNSRNLEIISPKIVASPKLLKAIVGTSKVYIRQIQKDLDLQESIECVSPEVMLFTLYIQTC